MRSLRRKVRKLEDRIAELEKSTSKSHEDKETARIEETARMGEAASQQQSASLKGADVSGKEADVPETKNNQGETDPEAVVTKAIGDQNKFRNLCLFLFTHDELVSCTRTGKRTIKCMDNVKPQIDPIKFKRLETLVLKHTSYDKPTFHKKFENLQKVLRRERKELN